MIRTVSGETMKSLLSSIIDRQKESVNTLIKNCGIDRSTFYKIKNGKRIPTEEHLCKIIHHLKDVSERETILLLEEFEYQRYWKEQNIEDMNLAKQFLRNLNHSEIGSSPDLSGEDPKTEETPAVAAPPESVRSILSFLFQEMQAAEGKTVKVFIPARLINFCDFSVYPENYPEDLTVSILFPASIPSSDDPERKLKHVQKYFDFIEKTGCVLNVYRDSLSTEEKTLSPFPYWIIGRERMMVFDQELRDNLIINNSRIINKYDLFYDDRISKAYAIIKEYNVLKDVIADLNQKIEFSIKNQQAMYIMAALPSTPLSVSEEQIRKYIPEDADYLCAYQKNLLAALTCEFFTYEGFMQTCKNRTIPEWNLDLVYPEEELAIIKENIHQRIKAGNAFLLTSLTGEVPEQYSIAFFENLEINIQFLRKPSIVIQIKEERFLRAMKKCFQCRKQIAWMHKELKLTRDPFEEQKNDTDNPADAEEPSSLKS